MRKKDLECVICSMILHEPIVFPCKCLCWIVHLYNAKNSRVTCSKCKLEFLIPSQTFPPANSLIREIIDKESFLNDEERMDKKKFVLF